MALSKRPQPYLIPEYSLTGDLLAYLTCPLQYRYYAKAALPPSTPVQLWFGEFIHGVMEQAFESWRQRRTLERFPWDWMRHMRPVEMAVYQRLRSRGLYPPPQLFCPQENVSDSSGLCVDKDHPHKLIASERALSSVNIWGRHLFPLISEAEVKLRGTRPMPDAAKGLRRSNYYSVTGIIDVISSISLSRASSDNTLLNWLRQNPQVAQIIDPLRKSGYDVIVDYKGMRRPAITDKIWRHHEWQLITYAWLRHKQPATKPVAAGILFYLNELSPSRQDLDQLKKDLRLGSTDVVPTGTDAQALQANYGKGRLPSLSDQYREARSIRIIPIDQNVIAQSLANFDKVVCEIENAFGEETQGSGIRKSWRTNPEPKTCTACDFKTHCPTASPGPYSPTVP